MVVEKDRVFTRVMTVRLEHLVMVEVVVVQILNRVYQEMVEVALSSFITKVLPTFLVWNQNVIRPLMEKTLHTNAQIRSRL